LSDNRGLLAQLYLLPAIVRVTVTAKYKCLVRVISEVTHKLYINQL